MRRLASALALLLVLSTAACSSVDNTFVKEHGVCYRIQVTHVVGVKTHTEKVLAVPEDCQ